MTKVTEKMLDRELDIALRANGDFVTWFLDQTKFKGLGASYVWSRSDHPWGKVAVPVPNPETGVVELTMREGETDILAVFEASGVGRFALHIENKLASGKFTELQPELYAARSVAWRGDEKYQSYVDSETMLVAPRAFYERWTADAAKFDRYVPHEEIARFIPLFRIANL